MAGYIGLTHDFLQKAKLASSQEYESLQPRMVYIFDRRDDVLNREDLNGELVITLDDQGYIYLVIANDETVQLKPFRNLRKALQIMRDQNQPIPEELGDTGE